MITKARVTRTLASIIRLLRTGKTEVAPLTAKAFADELEKVVSLFESRDIPACFYTCLDGQYVKCRFVRLPDNIAVKPGPNGMLYINKKELSKILARRREC